MNGEQKPTREQIQASAGKTVPDLIRPGLGVLFCGINPGLYSGAVGHHFARPGNRFWRVLQGSGFTEELISPSEETLLLKDGLGITNIVERATATARELSSDELRQGAAVLTTKVRTYKPSIVAILGLQAFRTAFGQPAGVGEQSVLIGDSRVWVVPNPSGLQAFYQMPDLVRIFTDLRHAVEMGRSA